MPNLVHHHNFYPQQADIIVSKHSPRLTLRQRDGDSRKKMKAHIYSFLPSLPSHFLLVLKHQGVCSFMKICVVPKGAAETQIKILFFKQYISTYTLKIQEEIQISVLFPHRDAHI